MGKRKQHGIPEQVMKQADAIVQDFNKTFVKDPNRYFITRYKGAYLYIDRMDYDFVSHVCRLKYTDSMDKWEFAIFKYSDERYDADEWLFPGSGHVDGTVAGALKAGLQAYPD